MAHLCFLRDLSSPYTPALHHNCTFCLHMCGSCWTSILSTRLTIQNAATCFILDCVTWCYHKCSPWLSFHNNFLALWGYINGNLRSHYTSPSVKFFYAFIHIQWSSSSIHTVEHCHLEALISYNFYHLHTHLLWDFSTLIRRLRHPCNRLDSTLSQCCI